MNKTKVVWGHINKFAYEAGFILVPYGEQTYNLFNIKSKMYTHRNLTKSMVIQQLQNMIG